MVIADLHPRESERIFALQRSGVLDTPDDPSFDALTTLAARLCGTPISLVSLVDERRQWIKSRTGMDVKETPRELAICAHAILQDEVLVVPDTLADERFAGNELCSKLDGIRFYAGVPLVNADALPLGTLCVMDTSPRPAGLSTEQLEDLQRLAGQVVKLLDLERSVESHRTSLKESVHRTKNVVAVAAAIAARTLSESEDLAEAQKKLAARLNALSQAQSFLLDAAHGGAPLRGLIERQLSAFGEDDPRLTLNGCEVVLSGDAAEGIGLAVHELATNAVKYGALSVPAGKVDIRWTRRSDGGVTLEWKEAGGPKPKPARVQDGFGSMVVGALATQKIGGAATLQLPPDGARWTADISADRVVPIS